MLGALGTIGGAAAVGGAGTMAFFSDEEEFANNELVAGELDLKVDWTEHYSDWSDDEGENVTVSMTDDSLGFGFPSAADNKLLYVDDKDQFLENTSVEAYPDPDDDGVQEDFAASPGTTTSEGVGYVCEDGADAPEDFDPNGGTQLRTANGPDASRAAATVDSNGDPLPLVNISDVKPGDFGEVTFSIHLCGNPGYVWLTGDLVNAAENGLTEPEMKDEDEDGDADSTNPDDVELLDSLAAAVWYDTGEDGSYGTDDDGEGDNYHQANEVFTPLTGSLGNVLDMLEDGMVPLDYMPMDGGAGSGGGGTGGGGGTQFDVCDDVSNALATALSADLGIPTARNISCEELDELLVANGYVEPGTEYVGTKFEVNDNGTKDESDDTLPTGTFTAGNGGTITIESVDVQGGSITLSTDFPVEVVSMKGGNQGEKQYIFEDQGGTANDGIDEQYGCILDSVTFQTPNNVTGQGNETVAAISNVELCYDPNIPDDDGGGQQNGGLECFPNSTTAYIGFEWWLPVDHANEIQTDSVSFDLGFYTEQCRHNDGVANRS
jgi:predicted ribosomally synthesized peptide with SipW-like signal peptide